MGRYDEVSVVITGCSSGIGSDSLYSKFADFIEARSGASQHGAMPAAKFAGLVVEAATAQRPPVVLRGGKNSFLLPFLARLPVRWRDRILSRKFGPTK